MGLTTISRDDLPSPTGTPNAIFRVWGPLSLRVSVTDRCQLRCLYCTPPEGIPPFPSAEILGDEEILWFVRLLRARLGLSKVHVTGGEPLLRPGIVGLVGSLAGEGIQDGVPNPNTSGLGAPLAMTTNGQRLPEFAHALRQAGLRRVNVTLNTLQPAVFRDLTGGGELASTLKGVEAAGAAGLKLKLNATVLRGINDLEIVDIVQFGISHGAQVRFIELMPIGTAARHHRRWFVPASAVLDRLRARFALEPIPRRQGSSSREYHVLGQGPDAVVGVISSCTQPFCEDCNRLRLTARGELIGCLAADGAGSVLLPLRGAGRPEEKDVLEKVQAVMRHKRRDSNFSNSRCMAQVGG